MISAKTIDKAFEFYLSQPKASLHNESIIYNNLWVQLTGLACLHPHPHRYYTKEEFTEKINSDKAFENFCFSKLDSHDLDEEIPGLTGEIVDLFNKELTQQEWNALCVIHRMRLRLNLGIRFDWSKSIDVKSETTSQIVDEDVFLNKESINI